VLYGSNTYEAAQIGQWIDFSASNIDLPRDAWLLPIRGHVPNDHFSQLATAKAKETFKKVLRILNAQLLSRTFLVSERVTLADIVVAMALLPLYTTVFEPEYRKDFSAVNRWFQTLVHQPNVRAVVGDVVLCEKAQVAPAAPAEEHKGGKKEKGGEHGKAGEHAKGEHAKGEHAKGEHAKPAAGKKEGGKKE